MKVEMFGIFFLYQLSVFLKFLSKPSATFRKEMSILNDTNGNVFETDSSYL